MNSVDMANALINRAKTLQEFSVEVSMEQPIMLNGVIPFDISIKDDLMVFKVYAADFDEAVAMVDAYIKSLD